MGDGLTRRPYSLVKLIMCACQLGVGIGEINNFVSACLGDVGSAFLYTFVLNIIAVRDLRRTSCTGYRSAS